LSSEFNADITSKSDLFIATRLFLPPNLSLVVGLTQKMENIEGTDSTLKITCPTETYQVRIMNPLSINKIFKLMFSLRQFYDGFKFSMTIHQKHMKTLLSRALSLNIIKKVADGNQQVIVTNTGERRCSLSLGHLSTDRLVVW
jgi:hypothetical protein